MNIVGIIAGFLSGLIGGMGLGGGAVLLIYLTVFLKTEQLTAQGINLLFFLPIGAVAVIIYAVKKKLKFKTVLPLAIGGVVGALGGTFLSSFIGGKITAKIFATILCFIGIKEIILSIRLIYSKKCGTLKKE